MPVAKQKQVVIVTGASRGLGREIALRFGKAGDHIVANFLKHEQEATAIADEISRAGGDAFTIRADVRIADEVETMIAETMRRWGQIDVVVNNAGIIQDGLLMEISEQNWDGVLDTNLKGAFHCIRAVSNIMSKQRQGHIINISSISGVQGRKGQANYSASKAGLIGLTKASAKELGQFNIKINAVLPGYMATDMGGALSNVIIDRVIKANVLGRINDPCEIADFVYHLSFMNNVSGQVFNLDSRIL